MPQLRLGAMRHTVEIERRTTAQQESGQQKDEWVLVARRRAQLVAIPGVETRAAQQELGRVPTVFRLRYIDGVLPSMRLTCDGKLYDIVSAIDPDGGLKAALEVTALEQVGDPAPST
jgi:SPP1 family predicted phage head-tail adaptor